MKKHVLAMVIAMISATAFAQDTETKTVVFSIGAELAKPIGDFDNSHSFGYGASVLGEFMLADKVGLTGNVGYINYTGKTVNLGPLGNVKAKSISQIPVLAGLRYYIVKDIYLSGQLGVSIFNRDIGSAFTYAPGIGAKFSVLDATLKYMGASKDGGTLSNVSLRVAFSF